MKNQHMLGTVVELTTAIQKWWCYLMHALFRTFLYKRQGILALCACVLMLNHTLNKLWSMSHTLQTDNSPARISPRQTQGCALISSQSSSITGGWRTVLYWICAFQVVCSLEFYCLISYLVVFEFPNFKQLSIILIEAQFLKKYCTCKK